jgi:hypothetical protein
MRIVASRLPLLVALLPPLTACGDGGAVVSAPPPALGPTPGATPSPTTTLAALIPPTPTANPIQPLATSASPSIANTGAQTIFPLLQTAVDASFGGDTETTSQGATLTHDATTGRYNLTLNNSALNVTNVPNPIGSRTVDGKEALGVSIPGHRGLEWGIGALDFTVYGTWLIAEDPDVSPALDFTNGGVFAGGYVTPANAVPITGSASYVGKIAGLASEDKYSFENVSGDVRFTVDFSARSISGVTSNGALGSDNIIPPKLNDISFTATYDPTRNLFEGTVRALPGGNAFSTNANGTVSGNFFGPVANELGGVWTLSDTTRRIIGSFAAKHQ